ncbi:E3 ubiquitin-protein ligase RNF19B-like [Engraulis encrasicolus]|uniref:E3 ubiquitin-protein ligase RNF19B-like n=1 Tax=Engraulis encrasicolus TaxID=184585 RepID=UPI002FD2B006
MGADESRLRPMYHPKIERRPTPTLATAKENTCRTCSSALHPVQGSKSQSSTVVVVRCLTCPGKPFTCGTCLSLWQGTPGDPMSHCPNKKCAVVGTLLTCGLITTPGSLVNGCPQLRACPNCYSLIMHDGTGCNNVDCPNCGYSFCYICLRSSLECRSYHCSIDTTRRQWFST